MDPPVRELAGTSGPGTLRRWSTCVPSRTGPAGTTSWLTSSGWWPSCGGSKPSSATAFRPRYSSAVRASSPSPHPLLAPLPAYCRFPPYLGCTPPTPGAGEVAFGAGRPACGRAATPAPAGRWDDRNSRAGAGPAAHRAARPTRLNPARSAGRRHHGAALPTGSAGVGCPGRRRAGGWCVGGLAAGPVVWSPLMVAMCRPPEAMAGWVRNRWCNAVSCRTGCIRINTE